MNSKNYISAIKIQQKKLNLPDAQYRDLLLRIAGVRSSKDLSETGCKTVLREFYRLDAARRSCSDSVHKSPMCAKIWALWFELQNYLPNQERTIAYLLGFIRRASGCANLTAPLFDELLTQKQLYKTIEALKKRVDQETENYVPF